MQSLLTRQLYSTVNASLAVGLLLAGLLVYIERGSVTTAELFAWLCLIFLITVYRSLLTVAFHRSAKDEASFNQSWLTKFRFGVIASGISWGLACLLVNPADLSHLMFLIFVLAGLSAGGVISYSADLVSAISYPMLVVMPLMVRLLVVGDSLSVAMALALILYLGFIILYVRGANRDTIENIKLRLDAVEREEKVRASEERLQKSELRYKTLVAGTFEGVVITSGGRILDVNEQMTRILGYERLELIGKPVIDNIAPEDIDRVMANIQQGTDSNIEHAMLRKDGSRILVEAHGQTINQNGYHMRLTAIRDITERKQAEEVLAENEEKLRELYNLSPLGIALTDMNGKYLEFNESFRRICGYPEEELKSLDYWTLTPKKYEADEAIQLESLKNTGRYGPYEKEYRRKDGSLVPLRLNGMLMKRRDGQNQIWSIVEDITLHKKSEEEIQRLAFYDPLTNLPNRRLLMDRLNHAMVSSGRSGKDGAIIIIDLDNFKSLNDTQGPDVGDLLLQQIAERLTSCVREGDTVSRLGGDEFVVMLEELSEELLEAAAQAKAVGEKILTTLGQPYRLGTLEYHNTSSIGVTLFADHQQGLEELLKQADIAMYQAKKAGRNTLRFFDPQMQKTINDRVSLESELRKALELQQFQLYYQIQVDNSLRPLGAEALVRWNHPEREMVSPAQFIPLAEETGLILPIGRWVLETACAQIKTWEQNALSRDLVLAVNVSAKEFRQTGFVTWVQASIQHHGINPKLLKLELTESLLLENIEDTVATMNALNEIGVQFSLDDFGTGYSSLQYLKQLPLDELKIDQSFVRDLTTDTSDKEIVRTIVAMAQ